jgi:hypothetical protein
MLYVAALKIKALWEVTLPAAHTLLGSEVKLS